MHRTYAIEVLHNRRSSIGRVSVSRKHHVTLAVEQKEKQLAAMPRSVESAT